MQEHFPPMSSIWARLHLALTPGPAPDFSTLQLQFASISWIPLRTLYINCDKFGFLLIHFSLQIFHLLVETAFLSSCTHSHHFSLGQDMLLTSPPVNDRVIQSSASSLSSTTGVFTTALYCFYISLEPLTRSRLLLHLLFVFLEQKGWPPLSCMSSSTSLAVSALLNAPEAVMNGSKMKYLWYSLPKMPIESLHPPKMLSFHLSEKFPTHRIFTKNTQFYMPESSPLLCFCIPAKCTQTLCFLPTREQFYLYYSRKF